MIRVKIQYKEDGPKKLLRFDESIPFVCLLKKIAFKLSVPKEVDCDDDNLAKFFKLTLEGDAEVQETSEIEHGDSLMLIRRIADTDRHDDATGEGDSKQTANNVGQAARKSNETSKTDEEEHDDSSVEDATQEMLKKRADKRKQEEEEAILLSSDPDSDDDDDDEDSEYNSDEEEEEEAEEEEPDDESDGSDYEYEVESKAKPASRKRKARAPAESPLEVLMDEKDVPAAPGKPAAMDENNDGGGLEEVSRLVDGAGRNKADQAVKDRVIKLLNTGFHDGSNEQEARNAMKLAQRLMRKHNLSQALLLKEREAKNKTAESSGEVLRGGMVKVRIVNRKTQKPAQFARWLSMLTHPISENFGVKSFNQTRRGHTCNVVFYGIYTNSQLAGYAFRVATERIAQMMTEYTPKKRFFNSVNTRSARLSYALGIVNGIGKEVDRNIRLEKEKRQRKLERARIAVSSGEAYEESDDEGDGENDGPGFSFSDPKDGSNDEGEDSPKTSSPERAKQPVSGNDLNDRVQELEREQQAAIVLVDHGEKVAEDVLKENDIKLSTSRRRTRIQFDHSSFRQGIEDSKEIDINQRALRDETRFKKEKTEK